MPLVKIVFKVPGTLKVLNELKAGPIRISPTVAQCAADIRELIEKGFAEYNEDTQELCLLKDLAV